MKRLVLGFLAALSLAVFPALAQQPLKIGFSDAIAIWTECPPQRLVWARILSRSAMRLFLRTCRLPPSKR